MKYVKRAQEILDIEIAGLKKVRDGMGEEFGRAAKLIEERLEQGGKVIVTGMGKSYHVGQKIAATLTSVGSPSCMLHPSEAMHGDMGIISDHDVLVALSYTGESEELLNLISLVKRRAVPVIALTGDTDSALAKHSTEVIPINVEKEACPFNMAPTTSTTVMMAVGDALAMVLLESRGFEREDYAKLHPGGAIGRALLTRVEDLMRTGERAPKVHTGDRVRDAVVKINEARAGAVAVVDDGDKVLGILTDGDLRRHILDGTDLSEKTVDDVMTRSPISIAPDELAVDLLAVYEQHNINSILVVDASGCLAGLVDIQDLPKFKIL